MCLGSKDIKSLFHLDHNVTYLNHGSFGACPKELLNTQFKLQKELEKEPVKNLAFDILTQGGNISAVFRNKKLPKYFWGYKVIDADKSDVRFKDPKNVIAGLYAKGRAINDQSGFVLDN